MGILITIHLATGGCIMMEMIAVITVVITKVFSNEVIMAGMTEKILMGKYSRRCKQMLSRYERQKVEITGVWRE